MRRLISRIKNRFASEHPRIIYHVGAWSGNFGDSIIQQSIKINLERLSKNPLEFRYLNCQQTEFDYDIIDQINKEGDLLLIGGGGLIFYRPQDKSESGWQWNIKIDLIESIKIPYVLLSVGYNQFEYDQSDFLPLTNRHLQKTVENAALFSLRNQGSKLELVHRGCDPDRMDVVPDAGMFLDSKPVSIPGYDSCRPHVGFNWTTDRENQTFPEPWQLNRTEFIRQCLRVLNYCIQEKNAQIYYIGHMGADFDREIIGILKKELSEEPIIIDEVLASIYPPNDDKAPLLVDVYRQMDLVLGMRGHSNIVSFGQHTPFIGLGSHRKIRYFLEDIGRPNYFFDVRPGENSCQTDSMIDLVKNMLDFNIEEKRKLADLHCYQRKIFKEHLTKILGIIQ